MEGRCEEVWLEAQENSLGKLSSGVKKNNEDSICRKKWGQSHFILHRGAICPYHSTEGRETVGRTRLKMGNKGVSLFHAGQWSHIPGCSQDSQLLTHNLGEHSAFDADHFYTIFSKIYLVPSDLYYLTPLSLSFLSSRMTLNQNISLLALRKMQISQTRLLWLHLALSPFYNDSHPNIYQPFKFMVLYVGNVCRLFLSIPLEGLLLLPPWLPESSKGHLVWAYGEDLPPSTHCLPFYTFPAFTSF